METNRRLAELLLGLVPEDGSPVGNQALKQQFLAAAADAGLKAGDASFEQIKDGLLTVRALVKGKGRGGSVRRLLAEELDGTGGGFDLAVQEAPEAPAPATKAAKAGKARAVATPPAPRALAGEETQILSYRHPDRRKNNPEVGMVTPATDPDDAKTTWQHDPHLDPALQWTGKAERLSFEVDTALWSLDTDYDECSLFPRQVFFPLAGKGEGWEKLKRDIRAELDEAQLDAFHGTVSLPFEAGENRKIAVKIVDDRGIESLKVVNLED